MIDVLCVIPARAGSKAIPNKNKQLLGGIPLWQWSYISACLGGLLPKQIVVSSDDPEILELATDLGVVARRRPDEYCNDTSSTEMALIDALQNTPGEWRHVLLLQPTSPIRLDGLVQKCWQTYSGDSGKNYDSLLTVTSFYDFCWREKQIDNTWEWTSSYNPQNRPMRQSLTRMDYVAFDNGNLYLMQSDMLLSTQCRIGKRPCVMLISELEGMQIDTPDDLSRFRLLFDGKLTNCIRGVL